MKHEGVLDGEVRAVGRRGEAVVETGEGIVLVPGALPGERVEVVPTASKRGARRARLRRVVRRSPERREPPCEYAARCGGCPLMIASPSLQQKIKRGFLEDACRGLPRMDETPIEWVSSARALGYRQRARLAWQGGSLGYRSHGSRRLTDVERCIVLEAPLQAAWEEARRALGPNLVGTGEILLQRSEASQVAVSLETDDEQPPSAFSACETLSEQPVIAGVTLGARGTGRPARWGVAQIAVHSERGGPLRAPYGAFTQANDEVNASLVDAVVELAEPEGLRVLELHAGIGNFTSRLAAGAKTLVAVERDPEAAAACRQNLEDKGLRARIVVGDADDPPKGRYDVVVLDPPRQGSRAFFERSGVLPGPKRLVYVSCDTATLGRDLRIAAALGFRLDRVVAFDMFPQTAHLESVVRLVRA